MEIAAIQETRITGILDPEIKMEELDSIGPKVEEVKEGATLTKIGSSGGEAGQRVEQEPEEKASSNWHAHFEEFLRTRSAGETLQQPDSKRPQVSAQGVSESNKWPRGLWVSPNQPPLIGGATEDDESHWDAKLPGERKEGTAGKDAVGLELQRQLFRTLSYEKADGPQNLCRELRELCRKWLVPERHTKEQMLELVTLEQFLAVLPLDMQKWLREHVPKSCAQAVTLAEDFLLRHRGVKGSEGQVSKEEFVNPPKPKEAQINMTKKKFLTKGKQKYNGNANLLAGGTGLTGSDEQSPLHEKTEETQQLMTSMKTGKENNFLGHGDPEENRQKANKANGTGKKKVEDQFASSQGVCRRISESPIWVEENEVKYNRSGEHFSQNSDFIMNEDLDVEEKPYKCWDCGQSFSSSSALLTHERTHVGEKLYKCSHCGENERAQTGQMPHKCSHCGNSSGLNPEDKIQAGEKPGYARAKRGKSCRRRSDFVKHQRTHAGGKSSRCSVCGKSFSNGSYLKLHERLHTGEKPYKCLHCGTCFTWRSHLRYHERIYTAVCSYCGKGFCHKSKRSKRGKTHAAKNSYICSACGMKPLTKMEHNHTEHDNLLGGTELTESKEQNPLLESTEETEQLMRSMKTGKQNNFLCQGEPDENRQRTNKYKGNDQEKVEDQIISSQGVCKSICEPSVLDEQNEVKYKTSGEHFSQSSPLIMHEDPDIAEKPYKCWHCGQSFSSSSTLVTHERTHVGEKLYKCSHCGESERTHTGQKPHKCSHCGNIFGCDPQDKILAGEKTYKFSKRGKSRSQKSDLKHQRTHTVKKCHKCSICGNNFKNGSYLKIHQRIHTSEKPYKCLHCGKCFTWSSQFRLHERIHTAVCAYCGKSFSQKSELAEHEKTHATKDSYVCFACGKIFNVSSDLVAHVRTHKEKPFECSVCGKIFKNSLRCIAHQKVHTKEKQHKCSHCGKSFNQRRGLKIHEKIHKGEKSHKYLVWGENVRNTPNLKSHERTHTGQKPYKCSYCDKTFRWPSHLALHEKIHTGKKPYRCSECERTFDRQYSLVEHMKIHSAQRQYICSDCGKSFTSSSVLLRHQKIHVGEEFCICSQCGKTFRQQSGQAEKVLKCSECIKSHCVSLNLVRRRTHAGDKPFECSVCGKTFRYSSQLISHQSVHKEVQPYQCLDCGASVVRRPNLMVSAGSQAGQKQHKCSGCEKKLS